jgi:hypothetical protein
VAHVEAWGRDLGPSDAVAECGAFPAARTSWQFAPPSSRDAHQPSNASRLLNRGVEVGHMCRDAEYVVTTERSTRRRTYSTYSVWRMRA